MDKVQKASNSEHLVYLFLYIELQCSLYADNAADNDQIMYADSRV
jgi:hypothetical protein